MSESHGHDPLVAAAAKSLTTTRVPGRRLQVWLAVSALVVVMLIVTAIGTMQIQRIRAHNHQAAVNTQLTVRQDEITRDVYLALCAALDATVDRAVPPRSNEVKVRQLLHCNPRPRP